MEIHVSNRDDSSSLLPIGKNQVKLFPSTKQKEKREISALPLDKVVDMQSVSFPRLLKIDVQGFELQVLMGCESVLNKFAYIYVECSFIELYDGQALCHEVILFLQERGVYLKGVYNIYYDKFGIAIQADLLFAANIG